MLLLIKLAKIVLLLIGLLPIVCFVLFFTIVGAGNTSSDPFLITFFWIAIISMFCLVIFYVVDTWRNSRVAKNQKALWTVVIICGQWLAFIVYWYLYLWRKPKVDKEISYQSSASNQST
jgi:hypothetical protein